MLDIQQHDPYWLYQAFIMSSEDLVPKAFNSWPFIVLPFCHQDCAPWRCWFCPLRQCHYRCLPWHPFCLCMCCCMLCMLFMSSWVSHGSTTFLLFLLLFFCDLWRLIQDGTMIIPVRLALVASSCTDKSVLAVQKDTPNVQRRLLTLGRYGVDPWHILNHFQTETVEWNQPQIYPSFRSALTSCVWPHFFTFLPCLNMADVIQGLPYPSSSMLFGCSVPSFQKLPARPLAPWVACRVVPVLCFQQYGFVFCMGDHGSRYIFFFTIVSRKLIYRKLV